MVRHESIPPGEYVPTADQRVIMHASWAHFEAILALRGDIAGPRMAYLDGVLELMSPSKGHERIKSYIGRLLEAYAVERGLELSPYGSWTLRSAPKEIAVEPDECYVVGTDQSKEIPDVAIEVVWTSGGIDKLEMYRRLGVPEVWFWRDGAIQIYLLGGDTYGPSDRSVCFPDLDVELLRSFLDHPTMTQAVRGFREALRRG